MPSRPKQFQARRRVARQQLNAGYDADRGSARERGYTTRWDAAAKGHRRAHPLCLGCEAIGRVTAAEVTDHVEPHKGDQHKFWDAEMWQSACRWHHDVVKQRLEIMFGNGEIAVADLWLDSSVAIRLTMAELPLG